MKIDLPGTLKISTQTGNSFNFSKTSIDIFDSIDIWLMGRGMIETSETMGKKRVYGRLARTLNFDSHTFCEHETVYRLKVETRKRPGGFRKFLAIEILYFENFQKDRRKLFNAHLIRNFTLKNVITSHFLIKWAGDEIWRHISFYSCITSQNP